MKFKRPRTLKRKFIKRNTGAKAQSKQILTLSKQIGKLTKTQFETVQTVWNRNDLSVDSLVAGTTAYICPLPKSMCNVYGQTTLQTQGAPDQRLPWADNLGIAAQPTYKKGAIFGSSEAARVSGEIHHMGGTLRWRLTSAEPSFSTYDVFVISPKKKQADQLITDRGLKGGTTPGGNANLTEGLDYISHPDAHMTEFNRKMWTVHYSRRVNFGHPGSTALVTNVNPANTDPRNNAIIAEGKVKLSAGGVLKSFNNAPLDVVGANDRGFKPLNASQIGYIDEQNEKTQYLVIVNNGVSADLETVNLSLLVKDYYKAAV